jgi:hypothetical protein
MKQIKTNYITDVATSKVVFVVKLDKINASSYS